MQTVTLNEASGTDVSFLLRALRRRKWLFLGLFLVLAGSALSGLAMRQKTLEEPTSFVSSAQLLVSPPSDRDVPADAEKMTRWFASEQLFREMMVSEDVLARVMEASKLDIDLADLRSMVTVGETSRDEKLSDLWGNFLVDIQVQASSPETAKTVADLVIKETIEYTQELAAREVIASRRQLEKMAQANKLAIETAERHLVEWRKTHDVWEVEQLLDTQGARINELQARKAEEALQVSAESKKLERLREHLSNTEGVPEELLGGSGEDLAELSLLRSQAKKSLQEARAIYHDSNDLVKEKLAMFEEADTAYEARKASLVQGLVSEQEARLNEARARFEAIEQQIHSLKNDQRLADYQIELHQLKTELETLKETQKELTTQINEAKVQEEKRRYLAAFTLIRKPKDGTPLAEERTKPADAKTIVSSLVFCLLCAGMVAVGAEALAGSLELRPKVEKTLGLPILGTLPRLDKAEAGSLSVLEQAPDSFASERFRSIVVNLMRQKGSSKRLLVTSCWPGEGKTFVARNLAVALSRFEAKTLLVDGDLRKPQLSQTIDKLNAPGFREYLKGQVPFEELTVSGQVPNLTVLPAGRGEDNPAELLGKQDCKKKLHTLGDDRTLLIDSSPLSVCSDSVLMAEAVDGVVLVVRAGKWEGKPELEHVLELEEQGVRILGVILNCVKDDELKYGSKSYQSGYYSLKRATES